MILYYTGADSPDVPQINPEKSLGGFISSSPVPNSRLNNLFSLISRSIVIKDKKEIRLIALKNTTGSIVNTIKIYSNVTGSVLKLKLAAVSPAINSCSQKVFEQLLDGETLPYQATLSVHEGVGNAIAISSMAVGEVIGIWIYREVDETKFPELNQAGVTPALTCQEMADLLKAQALASEEEIQLLIDFT